MRRRRQTDAEGGGQGQQEPVTRRRQRENRLPWCARVVNKPAAGSKVRGEPERDKRVVVQRRRVKREDAATDQGGNERHDVAGLETGCGPAQSHAPPIEQEQCRRSPFSQVHAARRKAQDVRGLAGVCN
jgi:hypothetical protein